MNCNFMPRASTVVALALAGAGTAVAQSASTQVSPQATAPLPTKGAGQAGPGGAVTGSARAPPSEPGAGPAQPSTVDKSQEQQGVLLKPGPKAGDMGAASGAAAPPNDQAQ